MSDYNSIELSVNGQALVAIEEIEEIEYSADQQKRLAACEATARAVRKAIHELERKYNVSITGNIELHFPPGPSQGWKVKGGN